MQAGVGLLVSDVMPIYIIIPRYSHNYAQFCQLLNSNLFTHRKIHMLLREATNETYGTGSISIILIFHLQAISFSVYFAFFTLHLYHKNTKNIILSYLSDLTLVSDREGIVNPFIALVARFLFVCTGTRDLRVVSYWIYTLVLKN